MKANELRTGNLIVAEALYTNTPTLVEVSVIWNDNDDFLINPKILDGALDLYYRRPKGIPLSTEIVEKIGFSKKWDDGYLEFQYKNFVMDLTDAGFITGDTYEVLIESLHQLQNLFFALTGEELPTAQVSDTTMLPKP